jgi:hypothetical protein
VQVVFYRYARERAATTRLPYPFVPIRDRLVLPCFRAVEAVVQFLFSDRPVGGPGHKKRKEGDSMYTYTRAWA